MAMDIKLDLSRITLGEMLIFEPQRFQFSDFVEFLARHSNLSRAEVEAIPLTELRAIMERIGDGLRELAVPKVNSPS